MYVHWRSPGRSRHSEHRLLFVIASLAVVDFTTRAESLPSQLPDRRDSPRIGKRCATRQVLWRATNCRTPPLTYRPCLASIPQSAAITNTRDGTCSILAALDLQDGHVTARVEDRRRSVEFIRLLSDLDAKYPACRRRRSARTTLLRQARIVCRIRDHHATRFGQPSVPSPPTSTPFDWTLTFKPRGQATQRAK